MKYLIKNLRRLLFGLALIGAVYGQGSQTAYQTIWSDQAQTGYSTAVPMRQIGQSGHLVNVYFSNAPAQSCPSLTGETMQFFLEGSFDNTNWTIIKTIFYIFGTVDANGAQATSLDGYGAYSYLRVRALWYAGGGVANVFAKCRLNGWYSGTVNGNRQPTDRLQANQDSYSRYVANITTATTTTLVTSAGANREITVWDMSVCSDGANNVYFQDSAGTIIYRLTFSAAASTSCTVLPYVGLYYMTTDYGKDLQVATTAATHVTINLKALRTSP